MTKQEEIREEVVEIIASALSDNDVRPRAGEICTLFHSNITEWLIKRRDALQRRKEQCHQLKPRDIQGEIVFGAKARSLQEVINYLNTILAVEPLIEEG